MSGEALENQRTKENRVAILSCFYNDAQAASMLFPAVGAELASRGRSATLVLVDDGSLEARPPEFLNPVPPGFDSIEIVKLHRNGGHQLAIAVGLVHLSETLKPDVVIVMDADGEDRPEDVGRLLAACETQDEPRIVFAARTKRSEVAVFRALYQVYRLVHFLLTGKQIRFGNFSAIPGSFLPRLTADANLRVHYAAAVVAGKVPHVCIPSARGHRLVGRSRLNLVGLVAHGLAAITCYNEVVGVRLLFCTFLFATILIVMIAVTVAIRFGTSLAIPGWATYVTFNLVLLLFQTLMLAAVFTFLAISRRTLQGLPFVSYYRTLIHGIEQTSRS